MSSIDSKWAEHLKEGARKDWSAEQQYDLLQDLLQLCDVLLAEVPIPVGCSNPSCLNLAGESEVGLAKKVCTGCKVVYYCGRRTWAYVVSSRSSSRSQCRKGASGSSSDSRSQCRRGASCSMQEGLTPFPCLILGCLVDECLQDKNFFQDFQGHSVVGHWFVCSTALAFLFIHIRLWDHVGNDIKLLGQEW